MEAKNTEGMNHRYTLWYLLLAGAYGLGVILPGRWVPEYPSVLGSVVFTAIAFFSLRAHIQALLALRAGPISKPGPGAEDWPKVSLVIPSFNEEAVLEQTIRSALAMDYPADRLELIYPYESTCTDRTEEIIRSFAVRDPRIRPLEHRGEKHGKAPITNFGIRHATGQIIGVFDADHVLNPDLVRLAVAQLRDRKVGCVRGRCRIRNAEQNLVTRVGSMERDIIERLGIYGSYRLGGFSNFGGGHGFFRREIFDEIGFFNEDILTEDIDFSVRLHLAGYEINVLPQMQSWEETPGSLVSLYHQRKRWSRGWMQVWRLHAGAVLRSRGLSPVKKADIVVSLFSSLASVFLAAMIPLLGLAALGVRTSYYGPQVSFWLWMYVTMTPLSLAWLTCILDQQEPRPPSLGRYFLLPLVIPYVVVLICVGWLSFMDEFVLGRPYSYVKTARTPSVSKGPVVAGEAAVLADVPQG